MLVPRTQDPEYWREFSFTNDDLNYCRDLIVETGHPMATVEISRAVCYRRVHQERARIKELLARGRFYAPAESYSIGEEVIFPALGFVGGVVVQKREGQRPGQEKFSVISVKFDDGMREFASEYGQAHKLSAKPQQQGEIGEGRNPVSIFAEYGDYVAKAVRANLSADKVIGFVQYNGQWFLNSLMPDVHIGYLNLAEAVIEVSWDQATGTQQPLTTEQILAQLELRDATSHDVAVFAVERALSNDERFINVGTEAEGLWLLRRLVPNYALETPEQLCYQEIPYSVEAIPTEVLSMIWAVPDELSSMGASGGFSGGDRGPIELVLTYPHWRAGTLQVTPAVAALLPARDSGLSVVTLLDERSGNRFTVWVSHQGKYITNLAPWYETHQIPPGAFVSLTRTTDPHLLSIGYRAKKRTQREFIREVSAVEGKLAFEIKRQPMAIEFDETMVMVENGREAIDALWQATNESKKPLADILREVFPALAQLSPQGTVHFNTIYTAVNILRRCPPEPLMAELSLDWRYVAVGNGYYAMDERVAV